MHFRQKMTSPLVLFFLSLLFLLLTTCLSLEARAAEIEHDESTWTNITIIGAMDKAPKVLSRFKYWLENQNRLGDDSSRLSQLLFRAALGYVIIPNLSIWQGYSWIDTGIPYTQKQFVEDRIWQQLLWTPRIKTVNLMQRVRFEERALSSNEKTAYRLRHLSKISIPIKPLPKWSVVSSDEVFWHTNNFRGRTGKGFDQNRFFIGLGYQLYPQATLELGYMNQYIRRINLPNFKNNILGINLLLNF